MCNMHNFCLVFIFKTFQVFYENLIIVFYSKIHGLYKSLFQSEKIDLRPRFINKYIVLK